MNKYASTIIPPMWLLAITAALMIARLALVSMDATHRHTAVKWHIVKLGNEEKNWKQLAKPRLYFFSASWWPPCEAFERGPLSNQKVVALIEEEFVPVKVIDDRGQLTTPSRAVERLRKHLNITVLPALAIADRDGRRIADKAGEASALSVYQFLQNALEQYRNGRYATDEGNAGLMDQNKFQDGESE